MATPIPQAVSGELRVYQGNDNNIWAVNPADGHAYQLTGIGQGQPGPPGPQGDPGPPGEPAPEGTYVAKSGDTMAGALKVQDAAGNRVTVAPTSLVLRQPPGQANFFIFADGNDLHVQPLAGGSIRLDTLAADPNGGDLRIGLATDGSGDLVITALSGPNQGKSANLTYGKWV